MMKLIRETSVYLNPALNIEKGFKFQCQDTVKQNLTSFLILVRIKFNYSKKF